MEKSVYRSYILVSHKLGKTPTVIWNDLDLAYGTSAPSYRTVCRWVEQFEEGRNEIEDMPRSGRPITATSTENIEIVRQLIQANPYISYAEIEAESSLYPMAIHTIIHDHLKLRKITSRYVPFQISEEQKAKRISSCKEVLAKFNEGKWRLCDIITGDESWIYYRRIGHKQSNASWVGEGEPPRTVVIRNRYEPKSMITVFFKSTGPVLVDCMDAGKTIDAKYYIKNCLKPALANVKQQRIRSGLANMKILHDNAKPHVAKTVKNYLESEGIIIIDHPPYSPDLAPCDFWLFDKIKQQLTDETSPESMKKSITAILESIPKEEYLKTFQKYLERMQLCINNGGDYFEHLIK